MKQGKNGLVFLEGLRVPATIGINEAERADRKILVIDVAITTDFKNCIESDDINETVDYMVVTNIVHAMCDECSWNLIERMGFDISAEILGAFNIAEDVTIRIRKDVVVEAEAVAVELTVNRDDLK